MNKATSPNGKYGILDTKDNNWMGTDDGPLRYEDEFLCRAAATIINGQFRTGARFRAVLIPPGTFTKKDTIDAPITAEEAIAEIEGKADK
jgi:hypothetical protein